MATSRPVRAEIHRVPEDHRKIQAAINEAQPGDVVLVRPGTYREHIKLADGITLRSDGPQTQTPAGLERARFAIIDGGGALNQSGVEMAEGSTLDGFTITNVGVYDDTTWQRHFDAQGEDLEDNEGAVQADGTHAAVSIRGVNCTVVNCIVHHNGDVGVAIFGSKDSLTAPLIHENIVYRNMGSGIGVAMGAAPVIRRNTCQENMRAGIGCRGASPIIVQNACSQNVRAGIGCREKSRAVIRGNTCLQNRRAGIGIRMKGTSPVVEDNVCSNNDMAGIGCRDGADPVLRNNVCSKNRMAGIGCRNGATPLIQANRCVQNEMAGIGVQSGANATVHGNICRDNKLVAIGVVGQSAAVITENELSRTGGMPPLIAVKDQSNASINRNRLTGGGVAAVLIQGQATVHDNTFVGAGPKQRNAVWVWGDSTARVSQNVFTGYQTAVTASEAAVSIIDNTVRQAGATAFVIKDSSQPAHVWGNTLFSSSPQAVVLKISGPKGVTADNEISSSDLPDRHETTGREK